MKKFNPRLSKLITALRYIKRHQPCAMSKIPITTYSGFMWLWGMRDQMGLLTVKRSVVDGRSHVVCITEKGLKVLKLLEDLEATNKINCCLCDVQIKTFFRVPNDEWKRFTKEFKIDADAVVCRDCYEKGRLD